MAHRDLADACRLGEALSGETVVDCHTHLGPWHNFHIPACTAEAMVRTMDRLGIATSFCSPHVAIGPDYVLGNREVMAAEEAFPGRILPYVTINPHYPPAEVTAEIEHWHALGRLRAFKIHPNVHGYRADGPAYVPLFEFAEAHDLPVLSHSWAGDGQCGPAILGALAERYPRVTLLIAHSASGWPMIEEACAAAEAHPNVRLDLTGSQLFYQALETMVGRIGAERILFGSDLPFIDPRPGLGRVLMARIGDEDKRRILGRNAQALFGLGSAEAQRRT